jgi:hypothetical protein
LLAETSEQLTDEFVINLVRTVEHNAKAGNGLGQIFG